MTDQRKLVLDGKLHRIDVIFAVVAAVVFVPVLGVIALKAIALKFFPDRHKEIHITQWLVLLTIGVVYQPWLLVVFACGRLCAMFTTLKWAFIHGVEEYKEKKVRKKAVGHVV